MIKTKPHDFFVNAGSTSDLCPIHHFLSDAPIYRQPNGDYAQAFHVEGQDPDGQLPGVLKHLSSLLAEYRRQLDPQVTLLEHMLSMDGYPLTSARTGPVVAARFAHLEKTAGLRSVRFVWELVSRRDGLRTVDTSLTRLQEAAANLTERLSSYLGIRPMTRDEIGEFKSLLLTLNPDTATKRLTSLYRVGQQLAHQGIKWTDQGVKIGNYYLLPFSLSKRPTGTRPDLFRALRTVRGNFIVTTSWTRKPANKTRRRADRIEGFIGTMKRHFLERVVHAVAKKEMERNARVAAAEKGTDSLGDIHNDLDKHSYGLWSLTGFLFGPDPAKLQASFLTLNRAVGDPGQAALMAEEPFAAQAIYRTVLGHPVNVRRWWLRDDHAADLALAWKQSIGRRYSPAMRAEYLMVYPTTDKSPFFYDSFTLDGLRGLFVIGPPRKGKTLNVSMMADQEAVKFGGFITIYDIGGGYESMVRSHGGLAVRIGLDGPRFAPWSLPYSEESVHAIWLLVQILLRKGGCLLKVKEEEELRETIESVYRLPLESRKLSSLILPPEQQEYLIKWVGPRGIYRHVFDNVEDELQLTRIQSFDFQGIEKHPDLIEPVLGWITSRKEVQRADNKLLHVPKSDIFDELWKHLQDPRMWQFLLTGLKTAGKRLGGITLLTHHLHDLGQHAELIKNAVPHTMFLPTPNLDRKRYAEFFDLNEVELSVIATLPEWHVALKTPETFKHLVPNPDPLAIAKYSTNPFDVQRREQLTLDHGEARALEIMALEMTTK